LRDLRHLLSRFACVGSESGGGLPPGFARRHAGRGPFSEAWFGKVDIAPGQAFWFRFTLLDGACREAAVWAIWFDEGRIVTGKSVVPLDRLAAPSRIEVTAQAGSSRLAGRPPVFHADAGHLDSGHAVGRAGSISFDLTWESAGRAHDLVPALLARAGVAKTTYSSSFIDIRLTGSVERAGRRVAFSCATGMLGHISGVRSPHCWAWAHCNHFDRGEDAVFEGLSARLGVFGRGSPPLSSFVLFLGPRRYSFSSPFRLVTSTSRFSRTEWRFSTRNRHAELSGLAVAPSSVALVQYTDTDGSHLWCHNSKLARMELTVTERDTGRITRLISSAAAAFEVVDRVQPAREADL